MPGIIGTLCPLPYIAAAGPTDTLVNRGQMQCFLGQVVTRHRAVQDLLSQS